MYHRAFVSQCEERGPRGRVQDCNDIQRLPCAPRRTGPPMSSDLDAKFIESGLNLAVVIPQTGQDSDQLLCGVHAHVVVKDRPPDLKHADKVVTDEEVVGQRRADLGRRV